ncbi:MAG: hypothetical protein GTN76_08165, partial [Candidatus Aenigmarchaeota archaeon]|nr:hypothetical protein [Candidatus Aenigmarchaeota archaeon]
MRLATDYVPDRWIIRLRKLFWNQLLLPGINLSDEDYETCLRYILKFKPGVLWGYTPALAGLVEYIRGQGRSLSGYRPELAIGWASPVYD